MKRFSKVSNVYMISLFIYILFKEDCQYFFHISLQNKKTGGCLSSLLSVSLLRFRLFRSKSRLAARGPSASAADHERLLGAAPCRGFHESAGEVQGEGADRLFRATDIDMDDTKIVVQGRVDVQARRRLAEPWLQFFTHIFNSALHYSYPSSASVPSLFLFVCPSLS